jgi:serine/threonine-protein kinase RsbW
MSETPQGSGSELIELSVPAQPASVDLVHSAVDQLWVGRESIGTVDRIRFETAVVEIFANIVEHAFRSDADLPDGLARRLDLRLEATDDEVTALFSDNGLPAELDLSDVTLPDEDAESGRGLAMAIAALDDLHYERVEGRNRWSLVCRRAGA